MEWSISADGSGFDELLDAMVTLRVADKAPKELYYYGAFANASSFDSYCGGGCVTGLCGLSDDPNDATVRACVGVGFTGKYTADTMAHEVGHAHGRYHAPCGGAAGADAKYPYSGAKIGSWGYDVNTKALLSPTKYVDLMSYCEPTFISDYGFQQLIDRMSAVSGSKSIIGGDGATSFRMVRVKGDGALTWGSELTLDEPLLSDPRTVTLEDAAGKTVASMTGHYYPYDHLPGGMLLVPSAKVPFATMKVSGLVAGVESRLVRATSP